MQIEDSNVIQENIYRGVVIHSLHSKSSENGVTLPLVGNLLSAAYVTSQGYLEGKECSRQRDYPRTSRLYNREGEPLLGPLPDKDQDGNIQCEM